MTAEPQEFITIGRVLRPQGRRGELRVAPETDFPERFQSTRQVFLWTKQGERRAFNLIRAWPHQGLIVLELEGLSNISEAEFWRGAEVQVPRSERRTAPSGAYFIADLEGLTVCANGQALGKIRWVETIAGGTALLHVITPAEETLLIPFAREYVKQIENGEMKLEIPEGLRDLNKR